MAHTPTKKTQKSDTRFAKRNGRASRSRAKKQKSGAETQKAGGNTESAEDASEPDPAGRVEVRENELSSKDFSNLKDQIQQEWQVAWDYMKPKWDSWRVRLKLYNNQRRDPEATGDPLMFTIQQSVLASLYEDKLQANWLARAQDDEDRMEHLNDLARFDQDEMEKDVLDYQWMWDSMFFGRGLVLMMEFDKDLNVPYPEMLDPLSFLRDPHAVSAQGDRKGRGAMQFGGYEFRMTRRQIEQHPNFFNLEGIQPHHTPTNGDIRSPMERAKEARTEAQGLGESGLHRTQLQGDNEMFRLTGWFTYHRGVPVYAVLAEDRNRVIGFRELRHGTEADSTPYNSFPIIDRPLFPVSHDWDGVSIPDLVEDKQRARAKLQNLTLKTAETSLYPRYLFDKRKIKNRNELNYEHSKHIGIEGDPNHSIIPAQNATVGREVDFIMRLLDESAQRATATPEMQQGAVEDESRTATELNLVSQKVDSRHSLAARIFGWSEKRFWRQWYKLYKDFFDGEIDEKIVRIRGALATKWLPLTRDSIVAEIDPDVEVESDQVAEARKVNELQRWNRMLQIAAQDPTTNIRYGIKEMGSLLGIPRDKVLRLMPPNLNEMRADAENLRLAEDKKTNVLPTDDDHVHLNIHAKAPDTPAKIAHINAHKRAMMMKKRNPEMFAQVAPELTENNPTQGQGLQSPEQSGGRSQNRQGNQRETGERAESGAQAGQRNNPTSSGRSAAASREQ